jgi:hypothetical protein
MHLDSHVIKEAARRLGDTLRQAGQDALCALDQKNADVTFRVYSIEPIGDDFARGPM